MSPALSGVVVAQDNEDTIAPVLDQLCGLCDEVVVVDGGSRDATPEIAAAREKVRLHRRPFTGDIAAQKNHAMDLARGEWILILDTDELLGLRALARIPWLIRVPFASWYSLPRYWLVERDGELRYLAARPFYRDRQVRLFRNRPPFRYDPGGSPIHHEFLPGRRGWGRPLRGAHLFHYTLLLQDRAARERKFARYMERDPARERDHRTYLWEDFDVPARPLPEPLPGDLRAAAAACP